VHPGGQRRWGLSCGAARAAGRRTRRRPARLPWRRAGWHAPWRVDPRRKRDTRGGAATFGAPTLLREGGHTCSCGCGETGGARVRSPPWPACLPGRCLRCDFLDWAPYLAARAAAAAGLPPGGKPPEAPPSAPASRLERRAAVRHFRRPALAPLRRAAACFPWLPRSRLRAVWPHPRRLAPGGPGAAPDGESWRAESWPGSARSAADRQLAAPASGPTTGHGQTALPGGQCQPARGRAAPEAPEKCSALLAENTQPLRQPGAPQTRSQRREGGVVQRGSPGRAWRRLCSGCGPPVVAFV